MSQRKGGSYQTCTSPRYTAVDRSMPGREGQSVKADQRQGT